MDHREAQIDCSNQKHNRAGEAGGLSEGGKVPFRIRQIIKQDDLARLLPLGREYHNESRYAHVPFSEAKFLRAHERIIAKPAMTLGVYVEREGAIVGAMSAEIGDYFLGTEYLIATNHFVYVSEKLRGSVAGGTVSIKLMRTFAEWAKRKGARELNMHVTSGIHPARTDKFLKKLGFEPYGGNYATNIKDMEPR